MGKLYTLQKPAEEDLGLNSFLKKYGSVEFSIRELTCAYQFKLWDGESESVHIVIKEGSDIMNWIKVGTKFDSKYYLKEQYSTANNFMTEISDIKKADEGRFKGHYIVCLSVANNTADSHQ